MIGKLRGQRLAGDFRCQSFAWAFIAIVSSLVTGTVEAQDHVPQLHLQNSLSPFNTAAFGIAVSPDGSRFAVAGREGKIEVYDSMNRHLRTSVVDQMVQALGFTPDGSLGVSLTADGVMRTHDPETWTVNDTVSLSFRCGFMAFSPVGNQVAVGGAGPNVLLYDLGTRKQISALGEARRTQGILFSNDGHSIIANSTLDGFAGQRSVVRVLERNSKSMRSYQSDSKELQRLVSASDSDCFASVGMAGRIEIYQRSDGRLLRKWTPSNRLTQMAIFVPGSRRLIVGTTAGFDIYDVSKPEPILSVAIPEATGSYDAAWIPGTEEFVVVHARPDKQVTRWSVASLPALAIPMNTQSIPEIDRSHPETKASDNSTTDSRTQDRPQGNNLQDSRFKIDLWAEASATRNWVSRVGTTLRASWIGNDSQDVLLQDENGKERIVPRRLLSADDNDFLDEIDTNRVETDSQPDHRHDDWDYRITSVSTAVDRPLDSTKDAGTASSAQEIGILHDLAIDSFGTVWLATDIGLAVLKENQMHVIATCSDAGLEETERKGFARIAIDRFDRVLVIPGSRAGLYEAGPMLRFNRKAWKRLPLVGDSRFADVARVGSQILSVGDFDAVATWDDNRHWEVHSQDVFGDTRKYDRLEANQAGLVVLRSKSRESLLWNGEKFAELPPKARKIAIPQWRSSGELIFFSRDLSAMWKLCELSASRNSVQILYAAERNRDRQLYSFAIGADNAIWISTAEGLFRLHREGRQRLLDPVNGLLPLPDGRLLTTFGGGRFDVRVLTPVAPKN